MWIATIIYEDKRIEQVEALTVVILALRVFNHLCAKDNCTSIAVSSIVFAKVKNETTE